MKVLVPDGKIAHEQNAYVCYASYIMLVRMPGHPVCSQVHNCLWYSCLKSPFHALMTLWRLSAEFCRQSSSKEVGWVPPLVFTTSLSAPCLAETAECLYSVEPKFWTIVSEAVQQLQSSDGLIQNSLALLEENYKMLDITCFSQKLEKQMLLVIL